MSWLFPFAEPITFTSSLVVILDFVPTVEELAAEMLLMLLEFFAEVMIGGDGATKKSMKGRDNGKAEDRSKIDVFIRSAFWTSFSVMLIMLVRVVVKASDWSNLTLSLIFR